MYNICLKYLWRHSTQIMLCSVYLLMAKGLLRILFRTKTFFQQHKACYLIGV